MAEAAQTPVDGINENLGMAPGPIQTKSDPLSFDELDQIVGSGVSSTEQLSQETAEEIKDEVKDAIKESFKETLKQKEGESEEATDEVVDETEDSGKEKEEPAEEEAEEQIAAKDQKTITFKVNEKDSNLPANAEFTVKVDGKSQTVPLQELLNGYSGSTAIKEKFDKFSSEKSEFVQNKNVHEQEVLGLQSFVNDLHQKMVVDKDPMGAIWSIAEAMGGNPAEVVGEFQGLLAQKAGQMAQMTPEQLKITQLEQQAELGRKWQDSQSKLKSHQSEQTEMKGRMASVIEGSGMDETRFGELYNELSQSGEISADQITPELVAEYHEELGVRTSIEELVNDVNPKLGDSSTAVEDLRELMTNNKSLSIADIKEIALEVYGSKAAKNLSKKLTKANKQITPRREVSNPQKTAMFFDDLELT